METLSSIPTRNHQFIVSRTNCTHIYITTTTTIINKQATVNDITFIIQLRTDWIGLDWIGLDQMGSDGLDQMAWDDMNRIGLDRMGWDGMGWDKATRVHISMPAW